MTGEKYSRCFLSNHCHFWIIISLSLALSFFLSIFSHSSLIPPFELLKLNHCPTYIIKSFPGGWYSLFCFGWKDDEWINKDDGRSQSFFSPRRIKFERLIHNKVVNYAYDRVDISDQSGAGSLQFMRISDGSPWNWKKNKNSKITRCK